MYFAHRRTQAHRGGHMDGWTDRQTDFSIPSKTFILQGYNDERRMNPVVMTTTKPQREIDQAYDSKPVTHCPHVLNKWGKDGHTDRQTVRQTNKDNSSNHHLCFTAKDQQETLILKETLPLNFLKNEGYYVVL